MPSWRSGQRSTVSSPVDVSASADTRQEIKKKLTNWIAYYAPVNIIQRNVTYISVKWTNLTYAGILRRDSELASKQFHWRSDGWLFWLGCQYQCNELTGKTHLRKNDIPYNMLMRTLKLTHCMVMLEPTVRRRKKNVAHLGGVTVSVYAWCYYCAQKKWCRPTPVAALGFAFYPFPCTSSVS